jgi:hypothetical protein
MSQAHPWSQRNHDAARTCQSTYPGPSTGEIVWKKNLGGTPPGLATNNFGYIAVGATYNNAWWSQEVYQSVYKSTSGLLYHKKMTPFPWGFSQNVLASPAWGPDGNLVVASTNGEVLKLAPTGALKWTLQFRNDSTNNESPAVLPDGSIRHLKEGVRGISANGSLLFTGGGATGLAVNPQNGEMATGGYRTNEAVYQTAVVYMNANGTVRWSQKVYRGGGSMPLFGPDGTLYIGIGGGTTTAYTPTGAVKWSIPAGGYQALYALGKNGNLYIAGAYGVAAYSAETGASVWNVTGLGASVGNIAIDSNDQLYVGTKEGRLHSIQPTGALNWTRFICDKFTTGPAIGLDGTLAIAGEKAGVSLLYVIR